MIAVDGGITQIGTLDIVVINKGKREGLDVGHVLAIYQTFLTDISFYAGAYSTVGNAGADGIGTGSSIGDMARGRREGPRRW